MSVVEAVQRELEAIRLRDPALADGALAALALNAAGRMDDPEASHTSASMNHHQLRDTMVRLRELAPPERVRDELDELRERHAAAKDRPQPKVRKKQRVRSD